MTTSHPPIRERSRVAQQLEVFRQRPLIDGDGRDVSAARPSASGSSTFNTPYSWTATRAPARARSSALASSAATSSRQVLGSGATTQPGTCSWRSAPSASAAGGHLRVWRAPTRTPREGRPIGPLSSAPGRPPRSKRRRYQTHRASAPRRTPGPPNWSRAALRAAMARRALAAERRDERRDLRRAAAFECKHSQAAETRWGMQRQATSAPRSLRTTHDSRKTINAEPLRRHRAPPARLAV